MLWFFSAVVILGYAALLLFRDDASENIRKWIFPALLILGIAGGWYFGKPTSDDSGCTRYSAFADDC